MVAGNAPDKSQNRGPKPKFEGNRRSVSNNFTNKNSQKRGRTGRG